jgi:hypothetical protein
MRFNLHTPTHPLSGNIGSINFDARYVNITGDTMTGALNAPDISGTQLQGLALNIKTVQMEAGYWNSNDSLVPAHSEGQLYWDDFEKTLSVQTNVANVTLNLGAEQFVRARNNTADTITNGTICYISGVQGHTPTCEPATAIRVSGVAHKTIGVATHDLGTSTVGYITTFGHVHEIDTTAWSAGDILYLGSGIGNLTNEVPGPWNDRVEVGTVLESDANGAILVNVKGLALSALDHFNMDGITSSGLMEWYTGDSRGNYFRAFDANARFALSGAGGGGSAHDIISATHTDATGVPTSGHLFGYDGSDWRPVDAAAAGPHTFESHTNVLGSWTSGDLSIFNGTNYIPLTSGFFVGREELLQQYNLELDEAASSITYIGEALPGSATNAALWRIKRLDESDPTVELIIKWAGGTDNFDQVWDNRAGLSYS